MVFAPDTDEALVFDAALVNTVAGAGRSGRDELSTYDDLVELIRRFPFSGRIDGDEAELSAVRLARSWIRGVWPLERNEMVEAVNDLLSRLRAAPRLERHDKLDWHLHAIPRDAPLADRILVEAAMALVDVIRSDETGRLRQCGADTCNGMLVDLSRNASKRFCSVRCGNRMNMIAFRQRQLVDEANRCAE